MTTLRKHGRQWYVRVSLGRDQETGRYRTKDLPTGQTNKAEAKKVEASILASMQRGVPVEPTNLTVAELSARFMAERGKPNLAPATFRSYDGELRNHILPAIGAVKLRDLKPEMLSGLYADAAGAGLAQAHCLYLHRIVHRILGWAVKQKTIGYNVADAVEAPRVRQEQRPILTEDQVHAVLAAVRGTRMHALYWLALETGLRQGEIVARRWSDYDAHHKSLEVRTKLQREKGKGVVEGPTKATRPRSSVGLSTQAVLVLAAHRSLWDRTRALAGQDWSGEDWIFCDEDGRRMDPGYVCHHWVDLRRSIGIPDGVRFHDLRHTSATQAIARHEPVKVTQERLGHRDVATTLRMYGHALPEMHTAAAESRAAFLSEPPTERKEGERHA